MYFVEFESMKVIIFKFCEKIPLTNYIHIIETSRFRLKNLLLKRPHYPDFILIKKVINLLVVLEM